MESTFSNSNGDKKAAGIASINNVWEEFYKESSHKRTVMTKLLEKVLKYYADNGISYKGKDGESVSLGYRDFQAEIWKAVDAACKSYKPAGGSFFRYLNTAVINNVKVTNQGKNFLDKKSRTQSDRLQKIYSSGLIPENQRNEAHMIKAAQKLGLSEHKIKNVLSYRNMYMPKSLDSMCIDIPEARETNVQDERECTEERISLIEKEFNVKQERVKNKLSALLTLHEIDILLQLHDEKFDLSRFTFIDKKRFEQYCAHPESIPRKNELAKELGIDSTEGSRTLQSFLRNIDKTEK